MAKQTELLQTIERVLRSYPEFKLDDEPAVLQDGWRLDFRRERKCYGTFADTDRLRQVQRDILSAFRTGVLSAKLGRETRDDFSVTICKAKPVIAVNLQEEVARILRDREDMNRRTAFGQMPVRAYSDSPARSSRQPTEASGPLR
jgi:hypothetical protein